MLEWYLHYVIDIYTLSVICVKYPHIAFGKAVSSSLNYKTPYTKGSIHLSATGNQPVREWREAKVTDVTQ